MTKNHRYSPRKQKNYGGRQCRTNSCFLWYEQMGYEGSMIITDDTRFHLKDTIQ